MQELVETEIRDFDIAIVGMAGRFPEADSVDEFWKNLTLGKDCITRDIPQEEEKEDFVCAYGQIKNQEYFDAHYFGISDVEAEMLDPQQRLMLKLTQEAIEDAGIQVTSDNTIGLYAGADEFMYVWKSILGSEDFTDFDYYTRRFCLGGSLTSRVSYNMNFHGPSLALKAACATSTVATHLACQALLNYECDVAVAGGVEIFMGQNGYYVAEGTISKTGVTRPFDEEADGFVPGNGGALVVLKRLSDSIRDHDHIYAVIRGTAMNNDGNEKLGYTAPSVTGEYDVIRAAQEVAEVTPEDVSYIETHGTATKLGDAIELDALKRVFQSDLDKKEKSCAIGSVKSNVGHLNTVAGVAGIIKTALMLYHKKMVPTIHFNKAHPEHRLENTPFYVNTEYCDWESNGRARIAGVSSFGIGGTNCHIVMQEAPERLEEKERYSENLLVLSAKTSTALAKKAKQLADYIEQNPGCPLTDIAFTLQTGRNHMPYRRYESVVSIEDAVQKLQANKKPVCLQQEVDPDVVFLFPGTAKVSVKQIQDFCNKNSIFEREFTKCMKFVSKYIGSNLMENLDEIENHTDNYALMMSLIFSIDYAMAQAWISMGVKPKCVMGYSLGEYVAACISGALSLEDAIFLVYNRGKLFEEVEDGYMMTVMSDMEGLQSLLVDGVEISAYNAENRLTVSGLKEPMEQFREILIEKKIPYSDVSLGKPGHCYAVERILPELEKLFGSVSFHDMEIPMISTCSGKYITSNEIENPEHWTAQTRHRVEFYQAMKCMEGSKNLIWLECGFGQQLYKLVRKNIKKEVEQYPIMSMPCNETAGIEFLNALGQIWQYGKNPDWYQLYEEKPYKVPLPAYPFEEKYYFNIGKRKITSKKKVSSKEDVTVIYDGLSEKRFELTKYIASKGGNVKVLMEQPKQERKYSLTSTMQEQETVIQEIKSKIFGQSKIRCMWQYDGLVEAYDALCESCAADYFKTYHLFEKQGEILDIENVYKCADVTEEYKPLFRCMLETLVPDGHITIHQQQITVHHDLSDIADKQACYKKQIAKFPEFQAHMKLLLTCSSKYDEILSGKILGKEVLYPQGSYDLVISSSENVPTTTRIYEYCDILAQSIKHMAQFKTKTIKILEFGAGTGLITWSLAEALKDCDVEYYFTDVGRSFITAAQKTAKEKGYDFIKFARFDITKPVTEQDIPAGAFDFVISCNVIQAMDNMEEALSNISGALCENGTLCLLQTVWGHRSTEMIFGLCPEWWNYTLDPKRGDTPVISYDGWREFLQTNQFGNVRIFPEMGESDVAFLFANYKGGSGDITYVQDDWKEKIEVLKGMNSNVEVIYTMKEAAEAVKDLQNQYVIDEVIGLEQVEEKEENEKCEVRNETDQKIIDILYEVVGLIPERLEQPIFELDVDSLSGLIISTKIRTEFHISFNIKDLLSCNTIKELSDLVSELMVTNKQDEQIKKVTPKKKKSISNLLDEL